MGVNSGTDALWLVFMALGIGPGDEVITTSNTFFATAEAIWIAGATAVLVDCDPKTCNIDVNLIEAAITPKTKAIVPVHLYGQPVELRCFTSAGLAIQTVRTGESTWYTGFQYTPVDSMAAILHPFSTSHSSSDVNPRMLVSKVLFSSLIMPPDITCLRQAVMLALWTSRPQQTG